MTSGMRSECMRAGIPRHYLDATTSTTLPADGHGLYLFGSPGVGKTHTAAALAIEQARRFRRVRFTTLLDLQARIKATYDGKGSEEEALGPYLSADLLVLDDLGKEQATAWSQQVLYRIIDTRYADERTTVITSNYRRSQLAARLAFSDDDTMARSIVSRLAEMCESVEITGKDRRLQ